MNSYSPMREGMDSKREKVLREVLQAQGVFMGLFLAYTRDPWAADDLYQDLVVRACEKYEQADLSRPLRPWLLQIARNLARDHLRKLSRSPVLSDAIESLVCDTIWEKPDLDDEERRRILWQCVQSLGIASRKLVDLKYFRRLPVRSVAEELGRKVDSVYVALSRVRRRLQECVQVRLAKA